MNEIICEHRTNCNNFTSQATNGSRHPADLEYFTFLKQLPFLILCSIDGINKKYNSCRVNVRYWANLYKVSKRSVERALQHLRDEGLIKTLGVGKVSAMTKIRGAKRTLTLKAKNLLLSRKLKRKGPISQFMQSLADHNQRILNNIYIQENNNNYLPNTKPSTCEKPAQRDILSILEDKLRKKPNDLALQAMNQAKRIYKKITITNPFAYANALMRQAEQDYWEKVNKIRRAAQDKLDQTRAMLDRQLEYAKPTTDAISPFLMQIRKTLGG